MISLTIKKNARIPANLNEAFPFNFERTASDTQLAISESMTCNFDDGIMPGELQG